MDLNIRVAGEAGQGILTLGNLLVGSLSALGVHVLATQSYMSRIRGGLNWYDIRISDHELFAPLERADLLVALTEEALELLREDMNSGGRILYDGEKADGAIAIDFNKAAADAGAEKVMANSVAAGAVFALLGYDLSALETYLARQFAKKGQEVLDQNTRCARRGAELAAPYAGEVQPAIADGASDYVINGAQAVALGAAVSGVKFVTSYPMTPSTGTLWDLARIGDRYGILVEQAEDEIAAINMVCGAVYAGVPALTTTSGGGFALMVEGLSLAGMLELPAVVLLAQRPGPATGLPTRTAQGDLAFALTAGHGEFPRAIYAPGTQQQSYDLTRVALETAHRFQTPAIVLTDQFLQDMQKNIPPLDQSYRPIDRCIVDGGDDYARYAVTDDGVSPRAVPGGNAMVRVDSDAHDETGRITEDLDAAKAQHDKRMRKHAGLTAAAVPPEYLGPDDAKTILVCWGSTYGPCREAVEKMTRDGRSVAMLHFSQVWPINVETAKARLLADREVIFVEGNSTGQFAALLRQLGLVGECRQVLRYDGLGLVADQIVREVGR